LQERSGGVYQECGLALGDVDLVEVDRAGYLDGGSGVAKADGDVDTAEGSSKPKPIPRSSGYGWVSAPRLRRSRSQATVPRLAYFAIATPRSLRRSSHPT
jgi:hypothetical protein